MLLCRRRNSIPPLPRESRYLLYKQFRKVYTPDGVMALPAFPGLAILAHIGQPAVS